MRGKSKHRRNDWMADVALLLFIIIVTSTVLLDRSELLPIEVLLGISVPVPVVEEIVSVPLNSDAAVYTKQEYSNWVSITISGSVERDGEFFHDALVQYDSAQHKLHDFRGFMIDGVYAFEFRSPSPDYNENHVYRFSHSVNGYLRRMDGNENRIIGFQVVNQASRDLEGVFTIEISSDSYKHKPERRGR